MAQRREISTVTLIRLLANAFEENGWRNEGDVPLELAQIYGRKRRRLSLRDLSVVPSAFYGRNETSPSKVLEVVNETLRRAR
jgi:hypothetical protein